LASAIIGDGSPGGNMVYIKQNTGVLRRQWNEYYFYYSLFVL
jgi:hypothetical protein